jgi:hypothetical protein
VTALALALVDSNSSIGSHCRSMVRQSRTTYHTGLIVPYQGISTCRLVRPCLRRSSTLCRHHRRLRAVAGKPSARWRRLRWVASGCGCGEGRSSGTGAGAEIRAVAGFPSGSQGYRYSRAQKAGDTVLSTTRDDAGMVGLRSFSTQVGPRYEQHAVL